MNEWIPATTVFGNNMVYEPGKKRTKNVVEGVRVDNLCVQPNKTIHYRFTLKNIAKYSVTYL